MASFNHRWPSLVSRTSTLKSFPEIVQFIPSFSFQIRFRVRIMKQVYEKQKCDISFDCRWCKIENLSRLLTLYGIIIRSISSLSTLLFIYFNCKIFTNVLRSIVWLENTTRNWSMNDQLNKKEGREKRRDKEREKERSFVQVLESPIPEMSLLLTSLPFTRKLARAWKSRRQIFWYPSLTKWPVTGGCVHIVINSEPRSSVTIESRYRWN